VPEQLKCTPNHREERNGLDADKSWTESIWIRGG